MIELPVIESQYINTLLFFLTFLPPSFLQISPILSFMTRREKIWIALDVVVIFCLECYGMLEIFAHGWMYLDYTAYMHMLPLVWIPYFLLALYWYDGHFFWNVFVVSTIMILMSITHTLTFFGLLQLIPSETYTAYYSYHFILTFVLFACMYPFLAKYLRNLFAIGRLDASSLVWREVVPVPVMMALQIMAVNMIEMNPNHDYLLYSRLTLLVTVFFFGRAIQTILKQTEVIWSAEAEQEELQTQMMSIEDYNRLAKKANNKLQAFLCDKRKKLEQIQKLLQQADTVQALQLIESMGVDMNRTKLPQYCTNALCNAAVSAYAVRADNHQIPLTVSLNFPEKIYMDAELSVVLSNLLENAIHASLQQAPEKRKISLIAVRQGDSDWVNLLIRNRFEGEVLFSHDGYPRSTRQGHGLGTRSLRKFVQDNGGDVLFECENGWFSVYLRLYCGQPLQT